MRISLTRAGEGKKGVGDRMGGAWKRYAQRWCQESRIIGFCRPNFSPITTFSPPHLLVTLPPVCFFVHCLGHLAPCLPFTPLNPSLLLSAVGQTPNLTHSLSTLISVALEQQASRTLLSLHIKVLLLLSGLHHHLLATSAFCRSLRALHSQPALIAVLRRVYLPFFSSTVLGVRSLHFWS